MNFINNILQVFGLATFVYKVSPDEEAEADGFAIASTRFLYYQGPAKITICIRHDVSLIPLVWLNGIILPLMFLLKKEGYCAVPLVNTHNGNFAGLAIIKLGAVLGSLVNSVLEESFLDQVYTT